MSPEIILLDVWLDKTGAPAMRASDMLILPFFLATEVL
jgi:hypothetical protein